MNHMKYMFNLININITKSYKGIEGAQVYIYSGTYRIIAQNDGINSSGETTEECRKSLKPKNFGPGGNNKKPGKINNLRGKVRKLETQCSIYHINIYGGNIYVNAEHDGLDANGNINILCIAKLYIDVPQFVHLVIFA